MLLPLLVRRQEFVLKLNCENHSEYEQSNKQLWISFFFVYVILFHFGVGCRKKRAMYVGEGDGKTHSRSSESWNFHGMCNIKICICIYGADFLIHCCAFFFDVHHTETR